MRRFAATAVGVLTLLVSGLAAQGPPGLSSPAEEFEAKLGYQTGTVTLQGGMATIRLPESFRFIGPEGSRRDQAPVWRQVADAQF